MMDTCGEGCSEIKGVVKHKNYVYDRALQVSEMQWDMVTKVVECKEIPKGKDSESGPTCSFKRCEKSVNDAHLPRAPASLPTLKEFVYFASVAYYDHGEHFGTFEPTKSDVEQENMKPVGFNFLARSTNSGYLNGYYGVAYINKDKRQIVVSHRGTNPTKLGAVWTDGVAVLLKKYASQVASAMTFVFEVFKFSEEHECEMFLTGHSLGAWLAQITTFSTMYLEKAETSDHFVRRPPPYTSVYKPYTVVFDSPGAHEFLEKMRHDLFPLQEINAQEINVEILPIEVYQFYPNAVNTTNKSIGTVYLVDLEVKEVRRKGFLGMSTHSMGPIEALIHSEVGRNDDDFVAKCQVVDFRVSTWELLWNNWVEDGKTAPKELGRFSIYLFNGDEQQFLRSARDKFTGSKDNEDGQFEGINMCDEESANKLVKKVDGSFMWQLMKKFGESVVDMCGWGNRREFIASVRHTVKCIKRGTLWWNPIKVELPANYVQRKVRRATKSKWEIFITQLIKEPDLIQLGLDAFPNETQRDLDNTVPAIDTPSQSSIRELYKRGICVLWNLLDTFDFWSNPLFIKYINNLNKLLKNSGCSERELWKNPKTLINELLKSCGISLTDFLKSPENFLEIVLKHISISFNDFSKKSADSLPEFFYVNFLRNEVLKYCDFTVTEFLDKPEIQLQKLVKNIRIRVNEILKDPENPDRELYMKISVFLNEFAKNCEIYFSGQFKNIGNLLTENFINTAVSCTELRRDSKGLVFLVDQPGAGKSCWMTQMVMDMKEELSDKPRLIVRVNLNQVQHVLSKQVVADKEIFQRGNIIHFITDFFKQVPLHKLQQTLIKFGVIHLPVYVLLDGLDEVCHMYEKEILSVLKGLVPASDKNNSILKVETVFLTSRPYFKKLIEDTFNVQAISLDPLTREDQVQFLINTYKSEGKSMFTEIMVRQMLKDLPYMLQSLIENPLMLFLYSKVAGESVVDMVELYSKFMETKHQRYVEEKEEADITRQHAKWRVKSLLDDNLQYYYIFAVQEVICLPNQRSLTCLNEQTLLMKTLGSNSMANKPSDTKLKELLSFGILSVEEELILFRHRSFAEYFYSRLLLEDNLPQEARDVLFQNIYSKNTLYNVEKFLLPVLSQKLNKMEHMTSDTCSSANSKTESVLILTQDWLGRSTDKKTCMVNFFNGRLYSVLNNEVLYNLNYEDPEVLKILISDSFFKGRFCRWLVEQEADWVRGSVLNVQTIHGIDDEGDKEIRQLKLKLILALSACPKVQEKILQLVTVKELTRAINSFDELIKEPFPGSTTGIHDFCLFMVCFNVKEFSDGLSEKFTITIERVVIHKKFKIPRGEFGWDKTTITAIDKVFNKNEDCKFQRTREFWGDLYKICSFCTKVGTDVVQDPFHVLFQCERYIQQRQKFLGSYDLPKSKDEMSGFLNGAAWATEKNIFRYVQEIMKDANVIIE